MNTLGNRLLKLRQGVGLTQADVVNAINTKYKTKMNGSMWSKWENDKDIPTMDNLRILADYFETTLDYLSGLSEQKNKNEIMNMFFNDPQLKVLFSLTENLSDDDIRFLTEMAKKMKGQ